MINSVMRLPECYKRDPDANNYKLLEIDSAAISELMRNIAEVQKILDLDTAFGNTLDLYGQLVDQQRGRLNDEQFRQVIRLKIGKNLIDGTYESIVRIIRIIFGLQENAGDASEIQLEEGESSGTVVLKSIPLHILLKSGFSSKQAVQMIQELLPVGVYVSGSNFNGTFEFAEFSEEYDEAKGFADLKQTMGGYLGLVLGDDDTIPVLPF